MSALTDKEFCEWVKVYRRRFISQGQESEFVIDWLSFLGIFQKEDLDYAVNELMADPRVEQKNPRHHLPTIIELARDSMNRRNGKKWLAEQRIEAMKFDRQRVAEGRMTQAEFDKKHGGR